MNRRLLSMSICVFLFALMAIPAFAAAVNNFGFYLTFTGTDRTAAVSKADGEQKAYITAKTMGVVSKYDRAYFRVRTSAGAKATANCSYTYANLGVTKTVSYSILKGVKGNLYRLYGESGDESTHNGFCVDGRWNP